MNYYGYSALVCISIFSHVIVGMQRPTAPSPSPKGMPLQSSSESKGSLSPAAQKEFDKLARDSNTPPVPVKQSEENEATPLAEVQKWLDSLSGHDAKMAVALLHVGIQKGAQQAQSEYTMVKMAHLQYNVDYKRLKKALAINEYCEKLSKLSAEYSDNGCAFWRTEMDKLIKEAKLEAETMEAMRKKMEEQLRPAPGSVR